jgi:Tfp pilus assembly protein PilV
MPGDVLAVRTGRRLAPGGLTLIEFLFAVSVVAFTGLGVAGMFPAAFRSVVVGGQVTKATILAHEMVDMIRSDPFDTLVSRYDGFDSRTDGRVRNLSCPVSAGATDYNLKKWTCDLKVSGARLTGGGLPSSFGTVAVACVRADGTSGSCGSTELLRVTVAVTWEPQGSRSVSLVTYVARTD